MIEGARKLPTQHLSVRIPWHDTAWDGRICSNPRTNTSCLALGNIADNRDDEREHGCAGAAWKDLTDDKLPPCVEERAGVLSPDKLVRSKNHPYKASKPEVYGHLEPTPLRFEPFAAACLPFRWMLRSIVEGDERTPGLAEQLRLGYQADREKAVDEQLGFSPAWVQDFFNQRVMLDTFFGALEAGSSLCFLYAKRTPLSEAPGRVLVGVGLVTAVGQPVEYAYSHRPKPGELRSTLWERNVFHSIRPGAFEGFVLPYQDILAQAALDERIDPAQFVAFAPEAAHEQFSYASEHVSHDNAIASLLAFVPVLERLKGIIPGEWGAHLRWIDAQLNRLWKMRGPFPGLGSALTAFGLPRGTLLAWQIAALQAQQKSTWTESPWAVFDAIVDDPRRLGPEFAEDIGASWRRQWRSLPKERRALLELLSRFDLSAAQAHRFYEPVVRKDTGIELTDRDLLANPYVLYEADRVQPDPIPLEVVDRGMRPDSVVAGEFPLPKPSALDDDADPRRLRAFVVEALEQAANEGHTLQTREQVIRATAARAVRPPVPCTTDTLASTAQDFFPVVAAFSLSGGDEVLQLDRFQSTGKLIRTEVERRLKGRPHQASHDWRMQIDTALGPMPTDPAERAIEERARTEKAAALAELFASRISVLIGPAGTGKTTLLRTLCSLPEVKKGGVLLLAPTGKARVRLAMSAQGFEAKTLAQCLLPSKRYDPLTGRYRVTGGKEKTTGTRTVIVDECSMLTEEALAAVFDELGGVERLILVGDPRQLPPIGSGRPFVDLVRRLAPDKRVPSQPATSKGFGELTVVRRQRATGQQAAPQRDDTLLASCFAGDHIDPGADEVWDRALSGQASFLETVRWETPEQLEACLLEAMQRHLPLASLTDEVGFETSLGGSVFKEAVYFHSKGSHNPEGAASKAEAWQILTPVRAGAPGVELLNRMVQARFRQRVRAMAEQKNYVRVPRPCGPQGILYGDKVISLANGVRRDVYPEPTERAYVANGDIGIVVGQYESKAGRWGAPKRLQVEFATQLGFRYGYWPSEFGDEASPPLELAYALTIHKAQGSEFGVTFVIIPQPCRLLSRELLYTALTRQSSRVVLLHQGDLHGLRLYGSEERSEVARRMTNLFSHPRMVEHAGTFLDEGLLHRTRRGDLVRSKSELILANILLDLGVQDYHYERALKAPDGSVRYPDFTVDDAATGQLLYIEHLGMLGDPTYEARWQRKLAWYRAQDILPYEEGGGSGGTLLTTTEGTGFDEPAIRARLAQALALE